MKVWIGQLKCPSNHCVLAAAGEFETEADARKLEAQVYDAFEKGITGGQWKRECGICKAVVFHLHIAATIFSTLIEAAPFLYESARQQEATRRFLLEGRN